MDGGRDTTNNAAFCANGIQVGTFTTENTNLAIDKKELTAADKAQ
jgi:hypothetical protein